jgi:twitching motility protein PilT
MQTLDQNLLELVKNKVITSAEARMKAVNKESFPDLSEG